MGGWILGCCKIYQHLKKFAPYLLRVSHREFFLNFWMQILEVPPLLSFTNDFAKYTMEKYATGQILLRFEEGWAN